MSSAAASHALNQIMAKDQCEGWGESSPLKPTTGKIEDIDCTDDEQTLCEAWSSHQEQISEIIPKLQVAAHVLEQDVDKRQFSDAVSTLQGVTTQILNVLSDIDKKVTQCHAWDGQASRTTVHSEIGSSILDRISGDPDSEAEDVGESVSVQEDIETATVDVSIEDSGDLDSQLGDVAAVPIRTSDIVAMRSLIRSDVSSPSGATVTVVALDSSSGELGEVMLNVPQKKPKALEIKQALAREYGEDRVAGVQLVIRSNGKLVPHRDTDIIRSKRTFATGLALGDI